MTIVSTAEPRPHPVVGSQLVRTWEPEATPLAEVVLVHGISEHSGRYERTGSILAEAGFRVTAADLVGCGATGGRRGHVDEWSVFLDQAEALLEDARATGRPTVLMGHSMGGLIALDYATSGRPAPDLMVLSAPGLIGGAAWQRRVASTLASVVPTVRLPTALKGEQLSRDPSVGEAYFSDPLVFTSASVRMGAELFEAMTRVNRDLHLLAVPTLVIHGGADTVVPASSSVPLGELPAVERRLYPTLRHEVLNEPEGPEIVAEIAMWIKSSLDVDD